MNLLNSYEMRQGFGLDYKSILLYDGDSSALKKTAEVYKLPQSAFTTPASSPDCPGTLPALA